MKHQMSLFVLFSLLFTSVASADCQGLYQDEIARISDNLIRFKKKEKKIIIGSAVGVAVPAAVLGGAAIYLIADGATLAPAILAGAIFGTGAGAIAGAGVAIPLITYNQIQKARIRGLQRVADTLDEARALNEDGKNLKRLLKQMQRKDPDLDMIHLITALNLSNSENRFCSDPNDLDRMRQVRRHLQAVDEADEEAETVSISS